MIGAVSATPSPRPAGAPAGSGTASRAPEIPAPVAAARTVAGFAAPATVWALAFVLLRIFAVSGYDWDTAFAVSTTLSLSDALTLLVGSLMSGHVLTEVLLVCLLPLLLASLLWDDGGRRMVVVIPAVVSAVLLVALTVSYGSWWLPVVSAAVLAVFAVCHRPPRRVPVPAEATRFLVAALARVGAVTAGAVLVIAAFIGTPWVPLEQITTVDGVIDGYVLSVDSGYLNVLTEDAEFLILISGDIVARTGA